LQGQGARVQRMIAHARRWKSTSGETAGDELICRPLLPGEVKPALRLALQSEDYDGAFLLVRLASADRAGICAAMSAIGELKAKVHIAFAIDLATLERLGGSFPITEGIGLVLDGVDVTTPLSALILDSIEAVRFDAAFTASASRNLRIDAALRAMLSLAHDLALSTFASEAAPSSCLLSPGPAFDYLLREDVAPIVIRGPKTQSKSKSELKTSRRSS